MKEKNTRDMFLTARQKAANDHALTKKMIDTVDGMLRTSMRRINIINECWHLHSGSWPEMTAHLGKDELVLKEKDGDFVNLDLNDFIVHHPKINNVTSYIMGHIISQPLIGIVRDYSAHGRKEREQQQLQNIKDYYQQNVWAPTFQIEKQKYQQEYNIPDMMALTPDEQRQVELDLQKRMKSAIPRSVIDDLQRIKTPDEKIRQVLLDYDIKAYNIEEKFIQGGEQAVVSYEEYYKIGRIGVKPTIEALNSKWVTWAGSEHCEYSEDGIMAKYEQYLTPQDFIMRYGREVIDRPGFLNEIKKYITEIPGYHRDTNGREGDNQMFVEAERDFVDVIGANPNLIKHDWRLREGQQEIAHVYNLINQRCPAGWGFRDVYTVFKWTEAITYVQREENGKLNEYFFSADYERDRTKDKMVRKFAINRVYHGSKIANRFYTNVAPVEWQYFGGVRDFDSKLTICGRKYSKSNGTDEERTLISPAIQYQLRYNITASKLEELEKNDLGKIIAFNTSMRPEGWSPEEYVAQIIKGKRVPYSKNQTHNDKNDKPLHIEDAGVSSETKEYRERMIHWEREMFKACGLNPDTLGYANQYQSNALTQSNITGSEKQLLPFHNKRRLVKERVLNYFNNLSLICFLEDKEKQEILLDEFSRLHLQLNADQIKGGLVWTYVVDDFDEAQNVKMIRAHILSMFQAGMSAKDIIAFFRAKSVGEMYDIAEVSEIRKRESDQEAHDSRMAEIEATNRGLQKQEEIREQMRNLREERRNQVLLESAKLNSDINYNAADVDRDNKSDALESKEEEMRTKERISDKDRASKERIEFAKLNQKKESDSKVPVK